MKKIRCIFCNNNSQRSKEHVWPKWLQEKIYGGTNWKHSGTHISFSGNIFSRRTHSGEALVCGHVCEECNTGWMQKLENNFAPILEKVLSNKNLLLKLSKEEREIFSVWSFKTVLMINSSSNYRRIIPGTHFNHLYKYRNLPKGVSVDVSFIDNDEKLSWVQGQNFLFFVGNDYLINNLLKANDKYKITMQIGYILVRVMWLDSSLINMIRNINYKILFRIWPYNKNTTFDCKHTFKEIIDFDMS